MPHILLPLPVVPHVPLDVVCQGCDGHRREGPHLHPQGVLGRVGLRPGARRLTLARCLVGGC